MMDYVDENDQVAGQASKKEIYKRQLTHRIVHVWIFNDAGELALQRRSASCNFCPLHWAMSAAGHVDAGESYEVAAHRELVEEMGVDLPLTFVGKEIFADPRGMKKFIGIFRTTFNGEFVTNPDEVDRVEWVARAELARRIDAGEPCHPQLTLMFQKYFANEKS